MRIIDDLFRTLTAEGLHCNHRKKPRRIRAVRRPNGTLIRPLLLSTLVSADTTVKQAVSVEAQADKNNRKDSIMSDDLKAALDRVFSADSSLYQDRGFMRRIGYGKKPALINIDLANA